MIYRPFPWRGRGFMAALPPLSEGGGSIPRSLWRVASTESGLLISSLILFSSLFPTAELPQSEEDGSINERNEIAMLSRNAPRGERSIHSPSTSFLSFFPFFLPSFPFGAARCTWRLFHGMSHEIQSHERCSGLPDTPLGLSLFPSLLFPLPRNLQYTHQFDFAPCEGAISIGLRGNKELWPSFSPPLLLFLPLRGDMSDISSVKRPRIIEARTLSPSLSFSPSDGGSTWLTKGTKQKVAECFLPSPFLFPFFFPGDLVDVSDGLADNIKVVVVSREI